MIEPHAGVEFHEVSPHSQTLFAVCRSQFTHRLQVVLLDGLCIHDQIFPRFRLQQIEHPIEWEVDLRLVQDVKDNHVMPTKPKLTNRLNHRFRLDEQIRKDHDQALVLEHARRLSQVAGHIGRPCGFGAGQQCQNV